MRHIGRRAAGLLGLACLAAGPPRAAWGQAGPGEAVRESASATVIEVPVTVIGKDGRPVSGLTAADFELFDDGKRRPISAIDAVDLSAPAPPPRAGSAPQPPAVPASARRLWLLVFDLSYSSPSGIVRARDGARDFVTRSMRESDLAAVGTLSVDTGWKLLVNFTRDKRQLGDAIGTLGVPSLTPPTSDPLVFAFSTLAGSETGALTSGNSSDREQAFLEGLRDMQSLRRKSNDELLRGRAGKLVQSLAGIGRVLDSVRGRKHVLFFSEGFESRLLTGTGLGAAHDGSTQATSALDPTTAMGAGDASLSGEIWKIDNDARFGSGSSRDRLGAALALFQRSDAVLDAVDIGGLRADGDPSPRNEGGSDTLFTMAADTGGDFVRNANQLGGELEKVSDRTSRVYVLAYAPGPLSRPGAFHKLRVEVKSPGARVIARTGYYEPRPYRSLTRLEQVLASGDLVTAGGPSSQIDARLLAAAFPSPAESPQVPIVLEIPGGSLLSGDSSDKSGVQIYAYATDARGNLVDYVASEIGLDLSKTRKALESGGLKFYGTLYLPPGDYDLRVLVRNAATGRSGVVAARLAVPAMPGGAPTVLPPLFPEEPGRWMLVRGTPRSDAPARPADYPFAVAGESFIPAALPSLRAGADAKVAIVAYNFGGAGRAAALETAVRLAGPDGRAANAQLKVEKSSDDERGGGQKRLVSFSTAGLAPGRYALTVVVTDPSSHSTAESTGAFELK